MVTKINTNSDIMANPFADMGGIVAGDRFVGREYELWRIKQRVLQPTVYGNLAITGLPRIGKSSLAWKGIMEDKAELISEGTIPVWFSAGNVGNQLAFYKRIFAEIKRILPWIDNDFINKTITICGSKIDNTSDDSVVKENITDLLISLKSEGFKLILILDEFDSVQSYLKVDDFQYLRDSSYMLDRKICIVTTSRKAIADIEAVNGAISNFYGTMDTINLGVYDKESIELYWNWVQERFRPKDIPMEAYKKAAEQKVGRHPYLLDVYNSFHFTNPSPTEKENIELDLNLANLFETILKTLDREQLQDEAIQLVLGPVYSEDIEQKEIKLLVYDFIQRVENKWKEDIFGSLIGPSYNDGTSYICFSEFFTLLLKKLKIDNIPYWDEWNQTERRIRMLIKQYLREIYQIEHWEEEIRQKFASIPHWTDNFEKLKEMRKKTLDQFEDASNDLVDYTLSSLMFYVFIGPAWNEWFGHIFGGTYNSWRDKFRFLSTIRNPIAHSNAKFVTKEMIEQGKSHCREINGIIDRWERRQSTINQRNKNFG